MIHLLAGNVSRRARLTRRDLVRFSALSGAADRPHELVMLDTELSPRLDSHPDEFFLAIADELFQVHRWSARPHAARKETTP